MEYHHINHQQMPHQQGYYGQSILPGASEGLNLPDASTSNEKALMWSHTQYMTESGYSTQAPSISSIDAFLNNEQMDSTMHNMDNESTISGVSTSVPQIQNEWNPKMAPAPQPVQQAPVPAPVSSTQPTYPQQAAPAQPSVPAQTQPQPSQQQSTNDDNENAVANWINYQDNSEMALKAIPELLKLLIDEDLVVVQQAALLFNQMTRIEGPRMALIQTNNAVQCLVDCLNTTADIDTARALIGALYGVSTQKSSGVQAIVNSKALQPLVKMLSAPMDTIVSFSITTIHNVLLDSDEKVKVQLRKMGAIHNMIPLINQNPNVKFLSIVVDCVQLLAFGNQEAKQIILELGGAQAIVGLLLNQCQSYQKLLLNTTRLLKALSVGNQKAVLVNSNVMQALSMILVNTSTQTGPGTNPQTTTDIIKNCLIILRNLSDTAARVNGLEQVVQNLLHFLSNTNDYSLNMLAACILPNLTSNNENNKKAALRANGIQILLKIIQTNMNDPKPQLLEPCLCALRHITNRHSDMLLAQEQVRSINGLSLIAQMMCIRPRSWLCIKPLLGIVRNFCSNQVNANQLRSNFIIEKLMQVLYDAYTEINIRTNNGANVGSNPNLVVKVEDVNLLEIVDISSASLLLLAKEYQNQIIMRDLDCIGFFVQMFYSSIMTNQKAASSILAELAASKECADVIERQAGLHQFVQANFCNQFGVLKTIAELNGNSNQANTVILQHVTTLMQRLQEHKNASLMQQQQQRGSFSQFPAQQPPNGMPVQQDQFGMPMPNAQQMYYSNSQVNMQNVYNQPTQNMLPPQAASAQQPQVPQQYANTFY